ncbi:MAG: hypothetical protein P4L43_05120 [Syntrophobacteraceae bacterium]|nr:hypothetical protein [Syntrophobacteraceae bacterium]
MLPVVAGIEIYDIGIMSEPCARDTTKIIDDTTFSWSQRLFAKLFDGQGESHRR